MKTFNKDALDALFSELESAHAGSSEYERILRDVHLGIALSDAGREAGKQIDPRAAAVIKNHKPK